MILNDFFSEIASPFFFHQIFPAMQLVSCVALSDLQQLLSTTLAFMFPINNTTEDVKWKLHENKGSAKFTIFLFNVKKVYTFYPSYHNTWFV